MTAMDVAEQRVAAGAAFLDQVRPGWADQIDLGRLQMSIGCRCVVGQLMQAGKKVSDFFEAARQLGLTTEPMSVAYGFLMDHYSGNTGGVWVTYGHLQDAWVAVIADRQLAATERAVEVEPELVTA